MKPEILFYDINQINFFKYIPELLEELHSNQDISIKLIYEENTLDVNALDFLKKFDCQKVNLLSNLNRYVHRNTKLVVVNAQRIPDSLIIAYSHAKSVPTLMIQHGMYNGHLKRTTSLFLNKFFKAIKYLIYSLKIGLIVRRNPITTSMKFMQTFIRYESYKKNLSEIKEVYTDYIHVYGEYWIDYHKDFFGYGENSRFEIVGYPEMRQIKLSKSAQICYIAQTIVEDGRGTLDDLKPVLIMLRDLASQYDLVVKRHPRSINKLYSDFGLAITDELPNADIYLGHYSSMLAVPISLKKKVGLISIKGHAIPEYFVSNSFMCNSVDELKAILDERVQEINLNKVFAYPISAKDQADLIIQYI